MSTASVNGRKLVAAADKLAAVEVALANVKHQLEVAAATVAGQAANNVVAAQHYITDVRQAENSNRANVLASQVDRNRVGLLTVTEAIAAQIDAVGKRITDLNLVERSAREYGTALIAAGER